MLISSDIPSRMSLILYILYLRTSSAIVPWLSQTVYEKLVPLGIKIK